MEFPKITSDGGRVCIIYTVEAGGDFPIHGAYDVLGQEWIPLAWTREGFRISAGHPTKLDITKELYKLNAPSQAKETQVGQV